MHVDLSRRPVDLALALVRGGAEVVVVGGAARVLLGGGGSPRDLDVVVAQDDVDRLVESLRGLGSRVTARALLRGRDVRVDTGYGPLDVFVADLPAAKPVLVDGERLAVAC